MNDIHVFTTKYYASPDLWRFLRLSSDVLGISLGGYGEGSYPGLYVAKMVRMAEYLETRTEKYVFYTDSGDSFFVYWSPQHALNTLKYYGAPMVMAAERNCHPFQWLAPLYPYVATPWKFINAGCFFGEREFILECLRKMLIFHEITPFEHDDQGYWTRIFIDDQSFAMDHECRLFQCMYLNEPNDVVAIGGRARNVYLEDSEPMVMHFNGTAPGMGEWFKKIYPL